MHSERQPLCPPCKSTHQRGCRNAVHRQPPTDPATTKVTLGPCRHRPPTILRPSSNHPATNRRPPMQRTPKSRCKDAERATDTPSQSPTTTPMYPHSHFAYIYSLSALMVLKVLPTNPRTSFKTIERFQSFRYKQTGYGESGIIGIDYRFRQAESRKLCQ